MAEKQQIASSTTCPQTLTLTLNSGRSSPPLSTRDSAGKSPMIEEASLDIDQDSFDSILCVTGPRLVLSGLKETGCRDDTVVLVNAGGGSIQLQGSDLSFDQDTCFEGGQVIGTDEAIIEGGDWPSMYQSARYGNFSYKFDSLPPGEYYVDLHFAEIVNTNGPKGIRVFDVYVQDEKVLSELDIYAVAAGANKPLQLVDVRASTVENGAIVIKFQGKSGSPLLCGVSIRRATKSLSALIEASHHAVCNKCATEIDLSPSQNRTRSTKLVTKYENKIQELTTQCKLKSDECYEAWMSLAAANEQLDKLTMDLDNKLFQLDDLEQALEKQTEELRDITERYQGDKKLWVAAIGDLEEKVKVMKQEHSQLLKDANECANSIPDMNKMVFAVQTLVTQCEDLKVKYSEEMARRKKLFNQVQEAKGNIRVFCRCRPRSKEDISSGNGTVVDFEAANDGDLGVITAGSTKKIFKFDRVYTPKDSQSDVYADASPMVTSVLDGYNVCIFAYGQTGTGKTFTMEGTEKDRGVNYKTLEELFKIAAERTDAFTYSISVSVLEVYNEQIRDLLATSPSSKKLEVRQAAEGFHHVPGIVEAKVENLKEVWDVLQAGSNARAVGSNNVNEHSSRSHCMLCIMVTTKNLMNGECTRSKLWLVDLAGSERLAKTEAQGERLKEAQNINRSLSALGDVISALASKSSHIPYRNSKLTHLLQDSLGGDSKALMFVQISPSENDLSETISSLNFASRVRGVELGPARKQVDTGELQKTKQMLDKVRQECRIKDDSVRKLEDICQNLENKIRGKEQNYKNLQEKNKELECQLSELQRGKEEACSMLQLKVKELENKMKQQQHSESTMLHQKVKELEGKLKEKLHNDSVAEQKVKELEHKLKNRLEYESILEEKVKNLEYKLQERVHSELEAEQKVKDLELNLKERQQSELILENKVKDLTVKLKEAKESLSSSSYPPMSLMNSANAPRAAAVAPPPLIEERQVLKEESTSGAEIDPRILGSSKSINRWSTGQGGSTTTVMTSKGGTGESVQELIKRKRSSTDTDYYENNSNAVAAAVAASTEKQQRSRKKLVDHHTTKVQGRMMIAKTPKVTIQKLFPTSTSRSNKDAAAIVGGGGIKERERTRGWH